MDEVIQVEQSINNKQKYIDKRILQIQRNLIMMDFDIEMINKIILYYNIESEDQAIDLLTKNSEGLWGHTFIQKVNEENGNIIINKNSNNSNDSVSIINDVTSKIKSIKKNGISNGISNIIYSSLNEQVNPIQNVCDVCGEPEEFHIKSNQEDNDKEVEDEKNNNDIILNTDKNPLSKFDNNLIEDINIHKIDEELNNNNISNEIEESKDCPICLSNLENVVELEKCHHKFCYDCFNNYLVDLINKNDIDKISCPVKNCNNKSISENFFHNYLTEEQYFKFRTFRSQNEISKDPKKMFCPKCDGYATIEDNSSYKYDPNSPNYQKSIVKCINGHEFCSCGIAIHDGDCYKDTKDFQKYLIKDHVKQCPKCGFYIKKSKGCNHMTCGNASCKYEFCWICMKEAVPGHFEFGQCKGMQFVDTNSRLFKLKREHPTIYKMIDIIRIIFTFILILGILFIMPSLYLNIFILFIFVIKNLNFFEEIPRLKNLLRLFHLLIIFMIVISLQSIIHFIFLILIHCLLLSWSFSIIGKIIDGINSLYRLVFRRNN